jgi:ABC-type nitrate/sulfonate/bicarbonate transport system substrate-binding protein
MHDLSDPLVPVAVPLGTPHIDTSVLRLGFVPLTDAAPLLVAQAKGLFRRHDVRVELVPVGAWAALRDKLAFGRIDGAQMLSPMPIAVTLGLAAVQAPLVVAATLGLNGNTITLGHALWGEIEAAAPGLAAQRPLPAAALAAALAARVAAGLPAAVLAVVYPFSSHNYLLRHWLHGGGIDPDRDVRLTVVPPPDIADALADGSIDGFCAGEPWGSRAVDLRVGRIALTSADIWRDHPEKVLAVTAEQAARHPTRLAAAQAAVIEAGRWLDRPENHAEAAHLLVAEMLPDLPASVVALALEDRLVMAPDEAPVQAPGPVFHAGHATYPFPAHGDWWLGQMRRWQHVPPELDPGDTRQIWRPDLWLRAAALIDEPLPPVIAPGVMPDGAMRPAGQPA